MMRCLQSRIVGIHAYVLIKWKQVPIMLKFEIMTIGVIVTNLIQLLSHGLVSFNGMDEQGLEVGVFGTNGRFVFIGVCNGITIQIKCDITSLFHAYPLCCTHD
jgi:hypothetical protein